MTQVDENAGYTGPMTIAAACGRVNRQTDTGEHTVIVLSLAKDCSRDLSAPLIRVRMEMTPEEAEDAARGLLHMAKAARAKK